MGPFEVTKEVVSGLNDTQLRKLLENLLLAEANQRNIAHNGIAVGGNQTAGDGGVDASIAWTGAPKPATWLPRRHIFFQCKAEAMAPAKLAKEMRPGGPPRPIFADLARMRGAYIIFSTDDPSKSAMDDRLNAMVAATKDVRNAERIRFDFYGADRIARWANLHLGVAIWLLGQNGRALGGWRPYGDWSAKGAVSQPYIVDGNARASFDDDLVDMSSAITNIRAALRQTGGVVRLVGLSGMGKTRLAEALFDERLGEGALAKAKAIYGDAGRNLEVGAARVAEELMLAGADAILVVDNANVAIHSQLAEIACRPGSRISVLTIDYDMGGENPAGLLVALGENSKLVLISLLKQRVPSLSEAECRHLAEFSGGNARIALKIAEGVEKGVDLSTLNDGELLERLFQVGRQERDPSARACADAAALVYAFYVEAGDDHLAEHTALASILGVNVDTFFRNVATFLEWGVIQQRGPQRAVMPPPFANMLAAPFIRRSDPATLLGHFLAAPPRLLASFARRLGQLHNEPAAVRLAQLLLGQDGLFGEPAMLDELLRHGFINLAPSAPEAALAAFERSLAGPNRDRLLDPHAEGRRYYPELLVHLAHESVLFARAMEVLLAFALADGDAGDDRKAAKHFLERFWPHLSFTLADQATRLAFIDRLLDDPDGKVSALGLEALDYMLEAGHFSSSLNLEFGAKAHLTEWQPRNGDGYGSWFSAAYERAGRAARANGREAERARAIIASHFREHLDAGLPELSIEAIRAARGHGYWDAGWRAVVDGLSFSGHGLGDNILAEVRALEHELRPPHTRRMLRCLRDRRALAALASRPD
ncbi:ATP-binding protein [Novosphingobium sp. G106]|uniref:ATP-binding protein n=1 Tax=Novosphingobium sp. G106 TaxID=2849500 RepID=UPI001C2DA63D|nr:ATP-binding protein [Novosphingobium sp. G106]MBV1687443.1 ATP-binding protein [Novosphingobium sp. G106]